MAARAFQHGEALRRGRFRQGDDWNATATCVSNFEQRAGILAVDNGEDRRAAVQSGKIFFGYVRCTCVESHIMDWRENVSAPRV